MRASARMFGPGALMLGLLATNCAPHGPRSEQEQEMEIEEAPRIGSAAPSCFAPARGEEVSLAEAEQAGERDAVLDLAQGKLALETYGRPRRCHAELASLLRREYAIEYRNSGTCAPTNAIVGHAIGYNEKMHAHIAAAHGSTAVEDAAQRAGCFSRDDWRDWP